MARIYYFNILWVGGSESDGVEVDVMENVSLETYTQTY